VVSGALPAPTAAAPGRIEDNSFLIEEAYNQEPDVVHHISAFQRSWTTRQWLYTFTEEWPIGGEDHQVSATLSFARAGEHDQASTGLGDVALHYRYRVLDGDRSTAVVRASALLPTGDRDRGLGEGRAGGQVAFPVSIKLGERLVDHVNVYGTWFPAWGASPAETTVGYGLGDGLVWLAWPTLNFLVEGLFTESDRRLAGATTRTRTLAVSPAFRSAIDFQSGLQIVWGLGAPIGVGPSRGDLGLFLYLSFEHPLHAH
jgi:hypothetical protein